MLKRILLALFVTCMINQSGFAQGPDLFLTFGQGVDVSNTTSTASTGDLSGTAFLFSRNGFDFDSLDILIDSSDTNVLELTGGEVVNSVITDPSPLPLLRFSDQDVSFEFVRNEDGEPVDEDGNLVFDEDGVLIGEAALTDTLSAFAISRISPFDNGVRSARSGDDEDFDADADAFLIAEIQYNIVGEGTANLDLSFGPAGNILLPPVLDPDTGLPLPDEVIQDEADSRFLGFGSATLTVTSSVPEPSSAALLVLGLTGMFARRRR